MGQPPGLVTKGRTNPLLAIFPPASDSPKRPCRVPNLIPVPLRYPLSYQESRRQRWVLYARAVRMVRPDGSRELVVSAQTSKLSTWRRSLPFWVPDRFPSSGAETPTPAFGRSSPGRLLSTDHHLHLHHCHPPSQTLQPPLRSGRHPLWESSHGVRRDVLLFSSELSTRHLLTTSMAV